MRIISLAVCLLAALAPSSSFAQAQNVESAGSDDTPGSARGVELSGSLAHVA
ncbi:hypothetical protein IIC65_09135, partial [Candidatus Sumerlaeota bacterium]|nr:hypothetical protein [Candidatus Sumerlaeota bacterium]